jgi:hypothetical protein
MPRPERPLDPTGGAVADFAAGLRLLRHWAGSPGYRRLSTMAHYSATTLSAAASGQRLPSLAVTLAYVRACGGNPLEWEARWWQTNARRAGRPGAPDPGSDPPCPDQPAGLSGGPAAGLSGGSAAGLSGGAPGGPGRAGGVVGPGSRLVARLTVEIDTVPATAATNQDRSSAEQLRALVASLYAILRAGQPAGAGVPGAPGWPPDGLPAMGDRGPAGSRSAGSERVGWGIRAVPPVPRSAGG